MKHLPPRIKKEFDAYFTKGCMVSPFVLAVLSNDLFAVIRAADEECFQNLTPIITYLFNRGPAGSHGSYEKVAAWQSGHPSPTHHLNEMFSSPALNPTKFKLTRAIP